jgi:ribonuclease P protein component
MLKKTFRLSSSKDIHVTSLRGRSFFSPYFVIKFVLSQAQHPRFTVVVSTKVSKSAVERNRLKRIVREAIRQALPEFKIGDYVIIVKTRAAQKPASEIRQQLQQLLFNVRLRNK